MFKRARQRREHPPAAPPTGVDGDIRRQRRSRRSGKAATGVDRQVAELATRQDGVVERQQLVDLGLSGAAIDHRVRTDRLIVVHRGVYAVGHAALSERATLRAGLIAAGPTASHSHRTSTARWRITASRPPFVEVTVTRKGPRSRPGLVIHETTRPPDIRILDGLPLTSPLRTLADLAGAPDIEQLCAQAMVLKLVTQKELEAAGILDPELIAPTRSKFERVFRARLREAGLPAPETGYEIGPYTADFAWPAERVIVETDGWRFHGHRRAFEDDRARDAYLAAHGWVVVRVTWRRLRTQPMLVMTQLAQTLAHRASTQGAAPSLARDRR